MLGSGSKILNSYLALTRVLDPVYRAVVSRRKTSGKEDPVRFPERFGRSSAKRPGGKLIWMHAASVGETLSLLGLIPALLTARDDLSILVTSGTRTSAELMERDLPDRAFHQFAPVDTPSAARRFLDHWQPDMAIWVESEIWPRMLVETKARGIPMLLMNARVSQRSLERWGFARRAAGSIFALFDLVLVQDQATNDLLASLGLSNDKLILTGSLKSELAPALPSHADVSRELEYLRSQQHWVAASTHKGEDEIILAAHRALPDTSLLVLVPRHPDRGPALAKLATDMGLETGQRSKGDDLQRAGQVYIADTIGEMGLWYRASDVSFIGGSLVDGVGGHNPFEPILLDANVIVGPHVGNFRDTYQALVDDAAVSQVSNAESLRDAVVDLWQEEAAKGQLMRARALLSGQASVTNATRDRILAMLP